MQKKKKKRKNKEKSSRNWLWKDNVLFTT